MGYYIFSSLADQIKKEGAAIPVIPLLFYHGTDDWPYRRHRNNYLDYGEEILPYIPEYEYIFHNLQLKTDEEILAPERRFWSRIFYLLKHSRDEDVIVHGAGIIFENAELEDGNLLKVMFVYFNSLIKSKAKTMKAIEFMPEPIQGKARNAYEEFILEGMARGSYETATKSTIYLFKKGVSIDIIAESFELRVEDVKSILVEAGLL